MRKYELPYILPFDIHPRTIRKDTAMPSPNLKLYKYTDPDNEGADIRWTMYVFAQDQAAANNLAIQEVARRMSETSEDDNGNDDSIPPEIGAQIIRSIATEDGADGPITLDRPQAHLMLVKLIEA